MATEILKQLEMKTLCQKYCLDRLSKDRNRMDEYMQTSGSTRAATKNVCGWKLSEISSLDHVFVGQHRNGTDRFYVEASEIKAFFETIEGI